MLLQVALSSALPCSFEITCAAPIAAGSEVTISYGSNKSNLALLSCYGFFLPGNPGDAQLLRPIFKSCLTAADGIAGFDQDLVAAAAAASSLMNQQQQQDDVQLARLKCAVDALPVITAVGAKAAATAAAEGSSVKESLQLQQYAAQLLVYQVQQMLRLCGTTADEDAAALELLADCTERGSQEDAYAAAVDGSIIAARLEQKLLLQECESLGQSMLLCIQQRLQHI
jgi:hypothetical protein